MSKVQEYLRKKELEKLGLPKVWVVHSTREGVSLPVKRQVIEIKDAGIRYYSHKHVKLTKYILDEKEFPYDTTFEEGKQSESQDGYASGMGDLWCWSYYVTLSKEDADEHYQKELKRVTHKYINVELNEAIEALIKVKDFTNVVDEYAKKKYSEKFPLASSALNGTFHGYKNYEILSPAELKVNYVYGIADMEYNDSFIVEID